MADALAEIRRKAAERYSKVPQSERPQLRTCEHCKTPIYDTKVCPATGKYHIVDEKNTLRIGTSILGDRKMVEGKELMAAFNASRIHWQEARVKLVRLDKTSADIFQSFPMAREWRLMRYGIMYGSVEKTTVPEGRTEAGAVIPAKEVTTVTVHTIYEPSQHGDEKSFTPHDPDAAEHTMDSLAALFGLVRVGVICTHPSRDKSHVPLSCSELILCTREQSRFGDHCVIVTAGPAVDQNNQITADAWQATEQSVSLYRAGLIDVCDQSEQYVQSKEPLEVVMPVEETPSPVTGKPKPPQVKEPSHFVDTKWLTGYCAIEAHDSPLFANRFARFDRPGELPLSLRNVAQFLAAPSRAHLPFADRLRDFHLLGFLTLSGAFCVKADMPAIVSSLLAIPNGLNGGAPVGGSSDAAAVANAMNRLKAYEERLNCLMKASR